MYYLYLFIYNISRVTTFYFLQNNSQLLTKYDVFLFYLFNFIFTNKNAIRLLKIY